jgi:hypothetical protein
MMTQERFDTQFISRSVLCKQLGKSANFLNYYDEKGYTKPIFVGNGGRKFILYCLVDLVNKRINKSEELVSLIKMKLEM